MTHLIDPLIAFVSAHAGLAYLRYFSLRCSRPCRCGIDRARPTLILALSGLIPGGELQLMGAGRRHTRRRDWRRCRVLDRPPRPNAKSYGLADVSNYPRVIAQSETFFHRWGTLAIFFARFVAPIRALVPITAGALEMPPARFYAVNIPAILLWACAHVFPGVLAIRLLHRYGGMPHHTHVAKSTWVAAVVAGSVLVWLVIRMLRRRRETSIIAEATDHGRP